VEIKVTLHGILRDYLPRQARGKTTLNLPDGATISDILQRLEIERTVSAAVDGTQVEMSHILKHGAEVHLFRPIGGG
jgi:molybdopterin synthase sulfur carrier subunit